MSGYHGFPTFDQWRPPFDQQTTEAALRAMEGARQKYGGPAMAKAVTVAARSAAVETGAIEGLYETTRGFTLSIAEMTTGWEQKLHRRGMEVERHVRDALSGYDFILDAVTGKRPISPHWLRSLHEILCKSQETYEVLVPTPEGYATKQRLLSKGKYKDHENSPTRADGEIFFYCPPEQVASEMNRFGDQLDSEVFNNAASVVQAAYAHYAFILIHPFADGNGRVARALASVYLYRSPGVPLVIFSDQRDAYLDVLGQADAGNTSALTRFVEARMLDAVQLVSARIRKDDVMDELARVIAGEDSTPAQIDLEMLWSTLRLRLRSELEKELESRSWPADVTHDIEGSAPFMVHPRPKDYNSSWDHLTIHVSTDLLGKPVISSHTVGVFKRFTGSGAPFVVATDQLDGERLDIEDLFPRVSDVTGARIRAVAGQAIDLAVADFNDKVRTVRAMSTE